jgi:hypothetical protein
MVLVSFYGGHRIMFFPTYTISQVKGEKGKIWFTNLSSLEVNQIGR